jgi:hypothetical protein
MQILLSFYITTDDSMGVQQIRNNTGDGTTNVDVNSKKWPILIV